MKIGRYGDVKLKVVIECQDYRGCEVTAETLATLEGDICDGGRIELDAEPDLPAGWTWDHGRCRCPEHSKKETP
jgi:hypothetical protein